MQSGMNIAGICTDLQKGIINQTPEGKELLDKLLSDLTERKTVLGKPLFPPQ